MTDEDGGAATVTASVTSNWRVNIRGLWCGPVSFDIRHGDEELIDLIHALTEAAGLHVHEPDGCHDDGCPCYARGAGR